MQQVYGDWLNSLSLLEITALDMNTCSKSFTLLIISYVDNLVKIAP